MQQKHFNWNPIHFKKMSFLCIASGAWNDWNLVVLTKTLWSQWRLFWLALRNYKKLSLMTSRLENMKEIDVKKSFIDILNLLFWHYFPPLDVRTCFRHFKHNRHQYYWHTDYIKPYKGGALCKLDEKFRPSFKTSHSEKVNKLKKKTLKTAMKQS